MTTKSLADLAKLEDEICELDNEIGSASAHIEELEDELESAQRAKDGLILALDKLRAQYK